MLLLIAGLALATIAWRRGPRPLHPDQAWGSVARWAARLGLGPRPSQTVFEFAGTLGDAVPSVRPELSTVAHAKVEIAYGRQQLGVDRMKLVAQAHRRLRFGLAPPRVPASPTPRSMATPGTIVALERP